MEKARAHFTDNYLLNPTNPLTVNVIGAGGTGSQVLTALARINESLVALGHAGLLVRIFDNDIITKANKGRQLFFDSEIGLPKAVALINRLNRALGTNWKAFIHLFDKTFSIQYPDAISANLTISCVDTVQARFDIASILQTIAPEKNQHQHVNKPYYWIDFGNSKNTGQVILSTVTDIKQPPSKKFNPVAKLPPVTDEFKTLLTQSGKQDNTPSCSLAEALSKQDLFINSSLANLGASLLWNLLREGMTTYRGFFLNLKDFRTTPITV